MEILEKYNYDLEKYEKNLDPFLQLYQYETIIKDDVVLARDTADQVWDKLTIELTNEKDSFQLNFKQMLMSF